MSNLDYDFMWKRLWVKVPWIIGDPHQQMLISVDKLSNHWNRMFRIIQKKKPMKPSERYPRSLRIQAVKLLTVPQTKQNFQVVMFY